MRNPFLTLIIFGMTLAGCVHGLPQTKPQSDGVDVVVSFYPLAYLASQIGGADITLTSIVPTGVEPHDYEPTPSELARASDADLFIFQGAGFDPWAEKVSQDRSGRGLHVLVMADHFELLPFEEAEHDDDTVVGHADKPLAVDPHIWLDPILMTRQAERIRDTLIAIDSANAQRYQERTLVLIDALEQLDADFQAGLASCTRRSFITTHSAFAYLADRYNLTQIGIAGLTPEAEPSPRALAGLVEQARQVGLTYIFFEELTSPEVAQTLASEIGGGTLVLSPIESSSFVDGEEKGYLELMEQNLINLRIALACQ